MPAELCAAVRDRLWASNLTRKLRRHDPSSWRAPFPDDDTSRDGDNFFFNRRWQVRSVGGEQVLMDMLPNACAAMATQLLGEGGFIDPRDAHSATKDGADRARQTNIDGEAVGPAWARCRGIYCTLPEPEGTERVGITAQPNFENDLEAVHFDSSLEDDSQTDGRFKVTGLIDDTPPGAGGFVSGAAPVSGSRQSLPTKKLLRTDGLSTNPHAAVRAGAAAARRGGGRGLGRGAGAARGAGASDQGGHGARRLQRAVRDGRLLASVSGASCRDELLGHDPAGGDLCAARHPTAFAPTTPQPRPCLQTISWLRRRRSRGCGTAQARRR